MPASFTAELIPIGRVAKTVGYKGSVLIDPYEGFDHTWLNLVKCLIRVEGVWAPFFVRSVGTHADFLEVVFEDLVDDKDARSVVNQEVFISPEQKSPEEEILENADSDWVGFTVIDNQLGRIGQIVSVEELPGQDLAIVDYNGRSVSIPLAEDLILEIDLENKDVVVNLPLGLLDL